MAITTFDEMLNETASDCQVDPPELGDGPAKKPNGAAAGASKQADILIELALRAELFHTPDGTGYGGSAYADVMINGHRETCPVRLKAFRLWLTREYYRQEGGAPNAQAMQSALAIIEARAMHDAPA